MNFSGFTISADFSDDTRDNYTDDECRQCLYDVEKRIHRLIFDCDFFPPIGTYFADTKPIDGVTVKDFGFVGNDEILFWVESLK